MSTKKGIYCVAYFFAANFLIFSFFKDDSSQKDLTKNPCENLLILSKINRSYLGTRYPHKLNCGHVICNVCMDEQHHNDPKHFGCSCPICKKPVILYFLIFFFYFLLPFFFL